MTSSAAPAPAASSHLHITTTATTTGGEGASTITAASPSSQHHSPSSARSTHSASSSPRGSSTGAGSGTGTGGTNQACAACKYQRRKCNPDCPLAPYFPADQQRRFLNAHRLFGVSNILKTLKRLRPDLCSDAMTSLIYQSDMRAGDPVGGCYRFILNLERTLEIETAELSAVLHHLALCRQATTVVRPPQHQQQQPDLDLDVTSSNNQQPPLLLNADQEVVDALYATHEADTAAAILGGADQAGRPQEDHGEQQQLFDYFYYEATASDDASSKPTIDINLDNMQQFDLDDTCAAEKVDLDLAPDEMGHHHLDVNCHQIDHKDYEIKAASLVDAFDMRHDLQPLDVNADVDVKAVDVGSVDIKAAAAAAVHVNANVDVNVDLRQEEDQDANNIAAGGDHEAAQMAAESSHCRLGLGFSSF